MSLTRRAALQVLGAAALPAVARAALPDDDTSRMLHERAAATQGTLFRADERALVSAIADAILPRTDTLGALDVGVPAWVELVTAEWMNEGERTAFRAGLAELEAHAVAATGKSWPALAAPEQDVELDWAEARTETPTPGQRTYRRLKSYVQHGYFTSERVQREVLRTNITPGRFLGCSPRPQVGEGMRDD